MDLFNRLPEMDLAELHEFARINAIPTSSQMSRALTELEIRSFLAQRGMSVPHVIPPDPMGPEMAREVGINFKALTPEYVQNFLQELGYFEPLPFETARVIIVTIYYERSLPVPETLWYTEDDPDLRTPYQMTVENFRDMTATFIDDTIDEFLTVEESPIGDAFWDILNRQPVPILLELAQQCPPRPHFETKVGLIWLLGEAADQNPGLQALLENILATKWDRPFCGFDAPSVANVSYFLVPPNRFEHEVCTRIREGISVQQAYHQVASQYKLLTPATQNLSSKILPEQLASRSFVDPNRDISLTDLMRIVRTNQKELRTLPDSLIFRLTGYDPKLMVNWTDITEDLLDFDIPQFWVTQRGQPIQCENTEDFLGNPIQNQDWIISYGIIERVHCYTEEELRAAFFTGGQFVFRRPENPILTFSLFGIEILIDKLRSLNRFRQFVRWLSRGVDEVSARQNISNVPLPDRPTFIQLFESLFQLGMAQRTWQGPGHPYPMTLAETRRQCDIPVLMTPILNHISDLIGRLSGESREIWTNLPVLNRNGNPTSQNINQMFEEVRTASACIAIAGTNFINSGYWYLRNVSLHIPNFDFARFEQATTHRNRIL